MSKLKFKHVFAALLALSAISAFLLPERFTAKAQPQVQMLFYPVARPVGSIAAWLDGRVGKPDAHDGRSAQALREENASLRQDVISLSQMVEEMRRQIDRREKLGKLAEFCTPFQAVGVDAGGLDGLLIRGSTLDGLKQGQYVLYWGGIAGVIERPPGLAGAEVRLISDKGFRVGACFLEYSPEKPVEERVQRRKTPAIIVVGLGDGVIRCDTALTLQEIKDAGVSVGDFVAIEDSDWDRRLQGSSFGKVTHIGPQPSGPLHAEIRIEPATKLTKLREVMVMTK